MSANQVALEFVRFVLEGQPEEANFQTIYDALSRAASGRSFRNLGHAELAQIGISFSLLETENLQALIEEAKKTAPPATASRRTIRPA